MAARLGVSNMFPLDQVEDAQEPSGNGMPIAYLGSSALHNALVKRRLPNDDAVTIRRHALRPLLIPPPRTYLHKSKSYSRICLRRKTVMIVSLRSLLPSKTIATRRNVLELVICVGEGKVRGVGNDSQAFG